MKSKILPSLHTIRMHYANYSSFKADCNRDEIKFYLLLQNGIARFKASVLSLSLGHHITSIVGNSTLSFIEDHGGSAALITFKYKFFSQAA